jgi:hypothetical protein
MRIVLDSVNYSAVMPLRFAHKIGYFNGKVSAWPASAIEEARAAGELLALVDVLGNAPRQAAIVDWEKLDVQDPTVLKWWVRERNSFRGDATIYCNRSSLANVLSIMDGQGEYWNLWLAAPSGDSQAPKTAPDLGLPRNVRLLGIQYLIAEAGTAPEFDYDLSIFYDDGWHGDRAATTAAAAAVTSSTAAEPAAAEPAAAEPAAAEPAAAPALEVPSTTSASSTSSTSSARPATPDPAAAESAESAVPRETATPSTPVSTATVSTTPAPTTPVPAPLPARERLPHTQIAQALRDALSAAQHFRKANLVETAGRLEAAALHAQEVGQLAQMAGL